MKNLDIIISDSSCIIALEDIGELKILQGLFSEVLITEIVKNEIQTDLPSWIKVSNDYEERELRILELEVDKGEASVIALALKRPKSMLIIDERKGRNLAKRLGLKIIGTLGLIIKAKQEGIIESGKEVLEKLENHGFWLSKSLKLGLLEKLNEK